ncbi:MAG: cyanoexosortase B system-associated protein [Leptolyngbyaceae cyanobacterium MO_188.B28]|nr:cyanoexosortase B system-associated protein [Leptolyngbyaceae cyanobacterium MO_188.B28]
MAKPLYAVMSSLFKLGNGRSKFVKSLIIFVLAVLAMVSAVPHYFNGQWPWTQPPDIANLKGLHSIKEQSLTIPGWRTLKYQTIKISGNDWAYQEIQGPDNPAQNSTADVPIILLLRPQPWRTNQPEVEWLDIMGSQQWKVDSQRQLRFTVDPAAGGTQHPVEVKARFLRGWNQRQTFAVVQWYAWPEGGNPSPSQWFWADQMMQWRSRERLPWVAVSILIPIEPIGDVKPYQSFATSLSQAVQMSLMSGPLAPNFN